MTEMAESAGASVSRSKPKFEAFLLGSIGDDSGNYGMQLSVLSALATRNVEPWEEAGSLTRLPNETTTQKPIPWIAAFSKDRTVLPDFGVSAIHLITPLSCGASSDIRSRMNCGTRASDDLSV